MNVYEAEEVKLHSFLTSTHWIELSVYFHATAALSRRETTEWTGYQYAYLGLFCLANVLRDVRACARRGEGKD